MRRTYGAALRPSRRSHPRLEIRMNDNPYERPDITISGGTKVRCMYRYRCTLHSTRFTSGMVGVIRVQS